MSLKLIILLLSVALILFYGLPKLSKKMKQIKRAKQTINVYKIRKECQKWSKENSYMQ